MLLRSCLVFAALASVLTGSAAAAAADAVIVADLAPPNYKLQDDLAAVLDRAAADELVPIAIVLRDRVSREQIEQGRLLPDLDARRAAVTAMLKSRASTTQRELLELLRGSQLDGTAGRRIEALWITNLIAVELTPELARRIAARADVDRLIHNPKTKIFDDPVGEPRSGSDGNVECGVELMGAARVWSELGVTGSGALIAICDSGTCYQHPDLINQTWMNPGEIPGNGIDDDNNGYIDDIVGWNFEENNNNPRDTLGHGTHTGGTIAGDGTNGEVTGMAPGVTLMIQRIGSAAGIVPSHVWESMEYAVDKQVRFMSMSFGWHHSFGPPRAIWREICENTIAAGTGLIIAAGNAGNCCPPFDSVATPGDVPSVITVGATDCNDVIAGFSSRGPVTWQDVPPYNDWPYPPGLIKPTVSAPGVLTISTWNDCAGYAWASGTSMATPHVAGAAALMVSANPDLTPEQVKQILIETSVDLGEPGPDNAYGAGRVDAFAAVVRAIELASSSEGQIDLDSALYACEDEVTVIVRDLDLNLDPNAAEVVDITIESDSEPAGEIITLIETGPDTSRFEALVPISETNAPGTLLVADGDTIVATYNDADNGQGQPAVVTAEATVDCIPPLIMNVRVRDVQARSATIAFDSNEPVFGIAFYGLDCNALNDSASGRGFTTTPTVEITGLQDNTTYFFKMEAEDEAGNRGADPVCYSFTTPEVSDFFTEQFASGFDLQGLSVRFTPDGGNDFYVACTEEIAVLPTPPAGGTLLPLTDDSFLQVSPPQPVSIYGTSYSSFFVGSNGYITFGAGDRRFTETLAIHFDLPRISGAFDDLNPASGGRVSWKDVGDRVAVTWRNVPEFPDTGANTFQIEIFYADGTIRVSYRSMTLQDCIAGLSEGNGLDPDFLPSDLSELGSCGLLGDLNCDDDINALDIEPFLLALFDPAQYPIQFPDCDINNGDINGDGAIDANDIEGFLGLLFP